MEGFDKQRVQIRWSIFVPISLLFVAAILLGLFVLCVGAVMLGLAALRTTGARRNRRNRREPPQAP